MSDENIYNILEKLFEDKKGSFRSYHEALSLLENPSPLNSDLTIAGEILALESGIPQSELSSILWINLELDVPIDPKTINVDDETEKEEHLSINKLHNLKHVEAISRGSSKATRSRALATVISNVQSVAKLHQPLFSEPQSWEEKIKNEKWITLSMVMDKWKNIIKIPVHFFCILLKQEEREKVEKLEWYKNGYFAFIYNDFKNNNLIAHPKLSSPLNIDEWFNLSGYTFNKQIDWLNKYQKLSKNFIWYYVGYEYYKMPDTRLWAAFTGNVEKESILHVTHFAKTVHFYFLDIIKSSLVSGRLDLFLEKMKDVSHEQIEKDFDEHSVHIKDFLGLPEAIEWPFNLKREHIVESLKSFSSCSVINNGERELTYCTYLTLLLGAIAFHKGSCKVSNVKFELDLKEEVLTQKVLPPQSSELAKSAMQAFFEMLLKLIWHESENTLTLFEIILDSSGLELKLNLDPYSRRSDGRSNLAEAIAFSIKGKLGLGLKENESFGETAKSIRRYWFLSNICDKPSTDFCRIFPPIESFQIYYNQREDYLIIKFSPWTQY